MNTKFLVVSLNGREHSKDLCVDGKIILKWILGKYGSRMWIGFMWVRMTEGRLL
jgi:hypothetical protein